MPTTISGSPNISVLDIKVVSNLCVGKFQIDLSPSVYIGGGVANVLGAKVKITNPLGAVVKPIGGSYDIVAGSMGAVYEFNIPTEAGNFQYGNYIFEVQLTDANSTVYSVIKSFSIEYPDKKNKTKKYGCLEANIKGLCKAGKAWVLISNPPTYKGQIADSTTQSLLIKYPTESELDPVTSSLLSFSLPLFEGVYSVSGDVCALYSFDDNLFAQIPYKVKFEKKISCLVDVCGVSVRLSGLLESLENVCPQEEKDKILGKVALALGYLKGAELAADCGEDASDHINSLEELLGCSCSCNANIGSPIGGNQEPSSDYAFTGCGFTLTEAGFTTNVEINNYSYVLSVNENNILTVGTPVLNEENCTVTLPLNLNVNNYILAVQAKLLANNGISAITDNNGNKVFQLGGNPLNKNTTIDLATFFLRLFKGNALWQFDGKTMRAEDEYGNYNWGLNAGLEATGTGNVNIGKGANVGGQGNNKTNIGEAAGSTVNGNDGVYEGRFAGLVTDGDNNTMSGVLSGSNTHCENGTMVGYNTSAGEILVQATISNTNFQLGAGGLIHGLAALITAGALSNGDRIAVSISSSNVQIAGLPLENGSGSFKAVVQADMDSISMIYNGSFTSQGSGTTILKVYEDTENVTSVGYGAHCDRSNQVALGDDDVEQVKVGGTLRINTAIAPTNGQVLKWDATAGEARWVNP